MLGAICGSAISMDLLAQSMDPYSAQKSMDCADICGSLRVVAWGACAVRGKYSHTCLLCNFSCNISGQFALYVWSTIPHVSVRCEAEVRNNSNITAVKTFRRRRSVILFRGL